MSTSITVDGALSHAAGALREAGIANGRGEARVLMGHVLDMPAQRVPLDAERPLGPSEWGRFREILNRRCERRPMAQVIGRREFWSLDFTVTRETLDPRPDSETVVEAAIGEFSGVNDSPRVLDLGAGTGCLLLSVLNELPRAEGLGVDISAAAVRTAERNACALDLASRARFQVADWGAGISGEFDLILSNPPYIPTGDIARLEPEVAVFEPRRAIDGGKDGLDCYRALAPDVSRLLAIGGLAVIELGLNQAESVASIMCEQGLEFFEIRRDLAGAERCLLISKS